MAAALGDPATKSWVDKKYDWLVGARSLSEDTSEKILGLLYRFKLNKMKVRIGKKLYPDGPSLMTYLDENFVRKGEMTEDDGKRDPYHHDEDEEPWPSQPETKQDVDTFRKNLQNLIENKDMFSPK